MKGYSRIPTTGSTHIDNADTTVANIIVGHDYSKENYGRMYILIKNVGADAVTDLKFRYSFDGTTFESFALISDAQADEVAAKLIGGGSAALCVPIPHGTLRIIAVTSAGGGVDCELEVYYTEFSADIDDVVVNSWGLVRDRQIVDVANATCIADNTDAIHYHILTDTASVIVQNEGVKDVMMNFGANTTGGTKGIWLKRSNLDGGGLPILGSGGSYEIKKFKGIIYFYCAATSNVRITTQK
jgi:uncharacterized protein YbaA (DUF1428 family)